jgi:hypothetical protein
MNTVEGENNMPGAEPLASPVVEYRWFGIGSIATGLVFGLVAIAVEPPIKALFLLTFFGVFFGIWMHLLVVRRMARRAVAEATPLGHCECETDEATLRRTARMMGLQAAGLIVIVLVVGLWGGPGLPFASGAFLGMGASMIATSRWLRGWEDEHSTSVLRAPHYRWRRDPQSGRRAGGVMDPRDFFLVPRG